MDAAAAAVEFDEAVDQGEERVVAALADALAGLEDGAQLPHEDIAAADLARRQTASRRGAGRWNRGRCGWNLDLSYVP